jgi:hypothetical protein
MQLSLCLPVLKLTGLSVSNSKGVIVLESILTQIDAEIARLQEARTVLSTLNVPARRKPGRPAKAVPDAAKASTKPERTLSPEARERMRQGQVKRWAAARKSAAENGGAQPAKKRKKGAKKTN